MGTFDFLKPKSKEQFEYVDGIGKLIYTYEFDEYAYRGKIYSKSLEYPIKIILPTTNRKISDYQKAYFNNLEENFKKILEEASKAPNSKIVVADCRINEVLIPHKENNIYDIDAEIVVSEKVKSKVYGKSIYSIIMKELNVIDIINI
ncbi:hypothetical protein BTO06_11860 [Tenacibaculum sp. SZ-18]|uniref:hypothetical protein n=1 Tax=Tenacibaculum sp. SZ-18 TaxID=754423 RepID=UPI000C2D086A|nr:hypothetical protein [Tenacibaculum sp. SZ-18]AUC15801.1 hypothetical protein BTO06_11860 [Tenacibaculum sp. SZ-18]